MLGTKIKRESDSEQKTSGERSSKKQRNSYDPVNYIENPTGEEDQQDRKLYDLSMYYEKILKSLKTIPSDEKDIFVSNALLESKNYEIHLSSYNASGHCIEVLLSISKDLDIWSQYMKAFSTDKVQAFSNASCSHITELLLKNGYQSVQNWAVNVKSEESSPEKNFSDFFISWLVDLNDFAVENLESCLQDIYACHVLNVIICALGGHLDEKTDKRSKNSSNHKKELQKYFEDEVQETESVKQIVLDDIPKFFKSSLKSLTKAILSLENICDYAFEAYSSTVIETLFIILKKRLPKRCRKLVLGLSSKLFEVKDIEGVPRAFTDKNGSFVIEKLFFAADEELQQKLWEESFSPHLGSMVTHRLGNHSFQKVVDSIENKALFEKVMVSMENLYTRVLSCQYYGVFVALAAACIRLKSQQGQFMKGIMDCLHCNEPEQNQLQLVPCVLSFCPFDQLREITVCLQGSLLVQNMLRFQKPIKVVLSVIALKPRDLAYLACNIQGCHVLNAFFNSQHVGEKNKDKLIQSMKPCLVQLSCDRNGSLTLSRLWTTLTMKQKSVVAQTLSQSHNELRADQNGSVIFKKFGLFYFHKYPDKWRTFQKELADKCHTKQ